MKLLLFLLTLSFNVFAVNNPITITSADNGKTFDGAGQVISNTAGNCISITGATNVTLRNYRIEHCSGVAIDIRGNSKNVTISNASLYDTGGIYALFSEGINVIESHISKVTGTAGAVHRNCIQFDHVTNVTISSNIIGNECINDLGDSAREDGINIYQSYGTASFPINIIDNKVYGYSGTSSGGGIVVGDWGGAYINVINNNVINTGVAGIAVAGGNHIFVGHNFVRLDQSPVSQLGIKAVSMSPGTDCNNITLIDNNVMAKNSSGGQADTWADSTTCFQATDNSKNVNNLNQGNNLW